MTKYRFKPFSHQLNEFILDWFNKHIHLFQIYEGSQFNLSDANETFRQFTEHYRTTGKIPMWFDDNQDNIFASTVINAMFRAWHDWVHVHYGFDFSLQGEIDAFQMQKTFLPRDWVWERKLMESEIVGQAQHYSKTHEPIESQRAFAWNYAMK